MVAEAVFEFAHLAFELVERGVHDDGHAFAPVFGHKRGAVLHVGHHLHGVIVFLLVDYDVNVGNSAVKLTQLLEAAYRVISDLGRYVDMSAGHIYLQAKPPW